MRVLGGDFKISEIAFRFCLNDIDARSFQYPLISTAIRKRINSLGFLLEQHICRLHVDRRNFQRRLEP